MVLLLGLKIKTLHALAACIALFCLVKSSREQPSSEDEASQLVSEYREFARKALRQSINSDRDLATFQNELLLKRNQKCNDHDHGLVELLAKSSSNLAWGQIMDKLLKTNNQGDKIEFITKLSNMVGKFQFSKKKFYSFAFLEIDTQTLPDRLSRICVSVLIILL